MTPKLMGEQKLRVAISGANGFVGTDLRQFLSSKNISIISLTRKKCKSFKSEKNIIFSDLESKNLAKKLRNCNTLVHLIGTGVQTTSADYQLVNVEQTKKIISLCKKANIKKIVYISGLGVNKSTTFEYFISKLKAEQQIIRSGLDYTILRASYILGKNDPLTKNLLKQQKRRIIIIPGSGKYRMQPISASDVSRVILSCVTNKKLSNKTVDLVGPQTISFERFIRRFIKGKRIAVKKIPLEQAYFDALNNPKNAIYGLDDLNILLGDFTSSHKRLEKLCGFRLQTPDIL
jgi:NADH dehydrogenase